MSFGTLLVAVFAITLFTSPACADFRADALAAYSRGDFKDAEWHLKILDGTGDAAAPFNLGKMAEAGHLDGCNAVCAAAWYAKSGERGVPLGYTMAGILLLNNGHKADGVNYLKFGARWNDPQAKALLTQMGEVSPPADLYAAEQARLQSEQAARAAQAQAEQIAAAEREWQATEARAAAAQAWAGAAYQIGNLIGGGGAVAPKPPTEVRLKTNCQIVGKQIYCN